MKTFRNLILGFILLSVLSCGRKQQPVLPRQEMAERLLMEADSLMRADSAFWLAAVNRTHPAVCQYDSAIRKTQLETRRDIIAFAEDGNQCARLYSCRYVEFEGCPGRQGRLPRHGKA